MKRAILIGIVALAGVLVLWSPHRDSGIDVEPPAATIPAHREFDATAVIEHEQLVFAEEEYAENEQDCAPKMDSDQIKLVTERLEREVGLAEKALLQSNNSEHQLAAVLLNRWDDPPLAMDLLQQSAAEQLNDPILVWTALIICGQRPALNCDLGADVRQLLRRANNVSSAWPCGGFEPAVFRESIFGAGNGIRNTDSS